MGIRGQLTALVPGAVAVSLLVLALLVTEQQQRAEFADLRLRRQQVLQAISVPVAVAVAQNDMGGLDTLIAHFTSADSMRDLTELAVVDDAGRVLAHSVPEKFNSTLSDDFTRMAIDSDGPAWKREARELRLAVPAKAGVRWATVVGTWSLASLDAHMKRERIRWFGAALSVFMVVSVLLFVGLDRLVVRPIRTLQAAVRRMGEGSLNARAPPLKGRELGELSEMVNRMAGSLQAERDNLERAVELRTRELQELNQKLERLAVTDGLTALYNHRRFQEGLAGEILRAQRSGRPISVLMIDVDLFKRVNDAMGHPAGDELLRQLALVLGEGLRVTDLLARYGGEEFAALLPETSRSEALAVAERMRAAVEAKVNVGNPWTQKVTVSIGVATFPDDGKSGEQVLGAADQALYAAKRSGRNKVLSARVVS